jgi:diguanylate cyclase (GGDEF)-like protein
MKIQLWTPKVYAPLLVSHLVVLMLAPAYPLAWSYAFLLAILGYTLFLCGRRLRLSVVHNQPLWALLLLSLVAQTAAYGLLFADSLANPDGLMVAFDPTFYFCLNYLLLLIAATYSPVGPLYRWTSVLDAILACAIGVLFYTLLRNVVGERATAVSTARFITWMFDGMTLFVAVFVSLRFLATRRADERRFYFVLLVFAWVGTIFPAIHNHLILISDSNVPEICLDVPFVILGILLSRRRKVWLRGYRPSRRTRVVVGSISPFVLSLALCLLALSQFGRNQFVAVGALILGIVSYAVRMAMMLGHHMTLQGELKRLQRGLQQAVVRDDLTRLINRKGFYRAFKRDWDAAAISGAPLTTAMVDIDMFKAFNDTYGHLAGDDCLAAVGRALEKEAALHRGVDVARYGGEEFAVLMRGLDHAASEHVAQRMRLSVAGLQIQNRRSTHRTVTVSVGLATTAEGSYAEMGKLLDAADVALYDAKHAGRNCVRWFRPDMIDAKLDRPDLPSRL